MSKEMNLELFDPRNDFVFKNIFGNEKYLDILKDFLEVWMGYTLVDTKDKEICYTKEK